MRPPGHRQTVTEMVGTVRYEVNGDAPYDKIGSARRRLEAYEKTGNIEHLADALNLIKIEMSSPPPGTHWKSSDDGDEHCGWRK